MMRTLGYTKAKLTQLLFYQTLMYSVPGTALGFLMMLTGMSGIHLMIYTEFRFSIYQEIGLFAIMAVSNKHH